jgi:hypothetical protein
MAIKPIKHKDMKKMIEWTVTASQWQSYWGPNRKERVGKALESFLVAYGGAWFSWFLYFTRAQLLSGVVGTFLIFNFVYFPWLAAMRRKNTFWPQKGKYFAYFSGNIIR